MSYSGYVYFAEIVAPSGPIKIGWSTDPSSRVNGLTKTPWPIKLIGAVKAQPEYERTLHRKFAAQRMCGEWFQRTDELMEFINARLKELDVYVQEQDSEPKADHGSDADGAGRSPAIPRLQSQDNDRQSGSTDRKRMARQGRGRGKAHHQPDLTVPTKRNFNCDNRTPEYIAAVEALIKLMRSFGTDLFAALWEAECAFMEATSDSKKHVFMEANDLQEFDGHVCPKVLTDRPCDGTCRWGGDHVDAFERDGLPIMLTEEPYRLEFNAICKIVEFCKKHGLKATMDAWKSWHCPGRTILIEYTKNDEANS